MFPKKLNSNFENCPYNTIATRMYIGMYFRASYIFSFFNCAIIKLEKNTISIIMAYENVCRYAVYSGGIAETEISSAFAFDKILNKLPIKVKRVSAKAKSSGVTNKVIA